MSAEVQGVNIEFCKVKSPLCRGFWQYLNGTPIENLELSESQKNNMKKYIQACNTGKSIYQIAQETGIGSFTCGELHRTKKQYKAAFLQVVGKYKRQSEKQKETTITENEIVKFLKTKKEPVSASICAKRLGEPVHNMYYRLQRLAKKGKIRKIKTSGFVTWEVVTE